MKIRIKECVGNSRIYGEDGSMAGTIEGWPKNGPAREICGTDGNVLYRVRKEKGGCLIENRTAAPYPLPLPLFSALSSY